MADESYQPQTYREQGGDRFVVASSGSLDVESGGEIDIESGGALKIAGTAIAASAAELNILDTATVTAAKLNRIELSPVETTTSAQATFQGIVTVSSTSSTGVGVYELAPPAAAGIMCVVSCLGTTGGVTLSTTAATIYNSTLSGKTLTFANKANVLLIAKSVTAILAIPDVFANVGTSG